MQKRYFTISTIVLALLLAGGLSRAEAKSRHFIAPYAGTDVNGVIDTNSDGVTASVDTGIANSNLGRFVFQGEVEVLPQLAINVTCPAGTLEFPLLQSQFVFTHERTGEQLLLTYTPGAAGCFDLTTLTFTSHLPGTFTGGTGRFVHATGTFEDDGISTLLVFDPKGHTFFNFTGTITGTLTGVGGDGD